MNAEFWANSDIQLKEVNIKPKGVIEDGVSTVMVDFANMYIGGGCMGSGCVQEEILFLIYPELLFSIMIFPPMRDNEAIVISGAKRYTNYEGYGWSLKYGGKYERPQEEDDKDSTAVFAAIDALYLPSIQLQIDQFRPKLLIRELCKAVVGFQDNHYDQSTHDSKMAVSTGKWGCGAFNGNPELKFLTQWIAASYAGRDMNFFTLNGSDCKYLDELYKLYKGKQIKDIFSDLLEHYERLKVFKEERDYNEVEELITTDKHLVYKFLKEKYKL